jgi:hypothetical protein
MESGLNMMTASADVTTNERATPTSIRGSIFIENPIARPTGLAKAQD